MDKFIIRKRQNEDTRDYISEELAIRDEDRPQSSSVLVSNTKKSKIDSSQKSKIRRFQENYLNMGFTWCDDQRCPKPKCVVCGEILSNEAMNPSKLMRHLSTKHSNLTKKPAEYFKTLLSSQIEQSKTFVKKVKTSTQVQEASYLVAELIAKEMKPHTIGETLILPACSAIVRTMFGPDAEAEIMKIPLSNDTMSRRIFDLSTDIEKRVINKVTESKLFSMQLDESTDIGGKAHLLVFIRFIEEDKIVDDFLCCKQFEKTTTGKDVFDIMDMYLKSTALSWESCVGICTDGAPSMVGCLKGFISYVKKQNENVLLTHCFIHREVLVVKTLGLELQQVLNDIIKMVNYIKTRALKSRIFAKLCEAMRAQHTSLILHTEIKWLSKGRTLTRFFELKEELISFFKQEGKEDLCELLRNNYWCSKLSYLTDIFEHLNKLNLSMQGKNENILSTTDKMKAFQAKIKLWNTKVQGNNMSMFPKVAEMKRDDLSTLICAHLSYLEEKINDYFPELSIDFYDWIRNPFIEYPPDKINLNLTEEEELIEIRNDRTLRLKHSEISLDSFWILIKQEYPNISEKAIKILLQFSTTYLCESGFSALVNIKNKKRQKLNSIENELRVCLSNTRPNIKEICKKNQAQMSH